MESDIREKFTHTSRCPSSVKIADDVTSNHDGDGVVYKELPPHNQALFAGAHEERQVICAEVHGTGNCFFDSICALMNVHDWHHQDRATRERIGLQFRSWVERQMTESRYRSLWERRNVRQVLEWRQARAILRDPQKWATAPLIIFTTDLLGVNLLVADEQAGGQVFCGTHRPGKHDVIFINWTGPQHSKHFEPIMRLDPRRKRLRLRFAHNDSLVRHILHKYNQQGCALTSLSDVVAR